jgi:hypothetical protein
MLTSLQIFLILLFLLYIGYICPLTLYLTNLRRSYVTVTFVKALIDNGFSVENSKCFILY